MYGIEDAEMVVVAEASLASYYFGHLYDVSATTK